MSVGSIPTSRTVITPKRRLEQRSEAQSGREKLSEANHSKAKIFMKDNETTYHSLAHNSRSKPFLAKHTEGKHSVAGHGLAKIFIMSEYQNIHHKAWRKDKRSTVLLLKDIVRLCPYKFHKTTTEQVKKQVKNIQL